MKRFGHSILGGTFDHFHRGHQALLDTAFAQSERITIGLTTEKFYQEKLLSQTIEPYEVRAEHLKNYLDEKNYQQVTIIELTDIYGPALKEKNIDAIFVTEDTLSGANKINEERKKIGFPPFQIITIPFVYASDNQPITSERIRLGEIDSKGNAYNEVLLRTSSRLYLPETLKETLRQPIGEIFTDDEQLKKYVQSVPLIITVGDIVTLSLQRLADQAQLHIIDLKTRRENVQETERTDLLVSTPISLLNPAGEINTHIATMLPKYCRQILTTNISQTIVVKGEEDLLTLPAILLAPLASVVVYGQYQIGAVVVEVTPEKKRFVEDLLKQFVLQN